MISIDTKVVFAHLQSSIETIIHNVEEYVPRRNQIIERILDHLKTNLCIYLEKKLHNNLPEMEKAVDGAIDGAIDSLVPEGVQTIVNDLVNNMMEDLVKEIDNYINNQ